MPAEAAPSPTLEPNFLADCSANAPVTCLFTASLATAKSIPFLAANFSAKPTPKVNQPIPSPLADRGPLELNVRHGTPSVPG